MNLGAASEEQTVFQLSFYPLLKTGRRLVFPCDASGRVDMDRLAERMLNNYLYARAVVGSEFVAPLIEHEAR